MFHIVQRIVCPLLLLVAGIGSLIYGTCYHREKVFTEEEIQITIPAPPPEMSPFGPGGPGGFGGPEGHDEFGGPEGEGMPEEFGPPPGFGPPAKPKTITEVIAHETDELESIIIKEITTGGLARDDAGDLMRTYRIGQKPDSLCPT